jgi:hypothetical protein
MKYCAELLALYRRHLGNTGEGAGNSPDLAAGVAMSDCEKGNTCIPVLESNRCDGRGSRSIG